MYKKNPFLVLILILIISSLNIFAKGLHALNPKDKELMLRFVTLNETTGRPNVGQLQLKSPNGLFLIHYDTIGFNAVSKVDLNKNGVSDYVDSVAYYFEHAYNYQVKSLGMKSPIPDDGSGGGNEYDIYLWDLGNCDEPNTANYDDGGVYGYTYPYDDDFSGKFVKSHSFIVIDNDFSPLDSASQQDQPFKKRPAYKESGIEALKITAVHEFQHAIQFRYGMSYPTNITIMEMSAMGMEFSLYPNTIDYLQHTNKIISNLSIYPFGVDFDKTGYGFSIFVQYFLKKFPETSIVKRMWEIVESGVEVYGALDSALKERNSSLTQVCCEFTEWLYHTGDKADTENMLWHSDLISSMNFYDKRDYELSPVSSSGALKPLEFRGIRYILKSQNSGFSDDTLDIIFANTDVNAASNAVEVEREYFTSVYNQKNDLNQLVPGLENVYYYIEDSKYICSRIFVNKGEKTINNNYSYPNPFNIANDVVLYIPVPNHSRIGDKASVSILNSDMKEVYNSYQKVNVHNSNLTISINLLSDIPELSSGVYLYTVTANDNSILGKFSVINK